MLLPILIAFLLASFAGNLTASGAVRENEYWLKVNPIGKPPAQPSEAYSLLESRLRNVLAGDLDGLVYFGRLDAWERPGGGRRSDRDGR